MVAVSDFSALRESQKFQDIAIILVKKSSSKFYPHNFDNKKPHLFEMWF